MKNNERLKVILVIVGFFVLSALLILAFGLVENIVSKSEDSYSDDSFSYSNQNRNRLIYNGEWYTQNADIESLLLLGIDSKSDTGEESEITQQAELIALLIVNNEEQSYQVLNLNKDIITDIPQTDTYEDTDSARCRNMVSAVENLLCGTDIDHYLSMPMDVITTLNDSMGNSTVQSFGDLINSDSENILETMMKINKYMVSDCTINNLIQMIDKLGEYSNNGIISLDEKAAQKTVVELFYELSE